jgi:hypothetical protein
LATGAGEIGSAATGIPVNPIGIYRSGGVVVVKEGGWFVKSVDPNASKFMQYWGKLSIEVQVKALARLRKAKLAPEYSFLNGVLRTADVGPALAPGFGLSGYFNPVFWKSFFNGSIAMRTVLNDIRPRNMNAAGIIFDPAWDPITKTIWAIGIPGGIVGGAYLGSYLNDFLNQSFDKNP